MAAGQEELLAALHQVLLVEGPWIHEVLHHDHEHAVGQRSEVELVGEATGRTGDREVPGRRLRPWHRRRGPQSLERPTNVATHIDEGAVGDVIEVVVDVEDTRQRGHLFTVYVGIGHGVAGGEAARDRDEVVRPE